MEDSITDLQSRSMRENLLFFGLDKYKDERKENCVSLIDDFCKTQLGLSSIGENIEKAHRVGKFDEGRKSLDRLLLNLAPLDDGKVCVNKLDYSREQNLEYTNNSQEN